jgi:hypothetical protein
MDAADIEPTPTQGGYWMLGRAGDVHAKGDAADLGDAKLRPGEKAVSLSATPSGHGYWVFTDKGRVVSFGDAPHRGDMAGLPLNGGVLGSVATPSGQGYWMVAVDGGIFAFGDAKFFGSMGGHYLNRPVMSMAPDPDGVGYWLVASDGGIFAFDAPFYGSTGSIRLNQPVSGMVPGDAGYLMVAKDGGIFTLAMSPSTGHWAPARPPSRSSPFRCPGAANVPTPPIPRRLANNRHPAKHGAAPTSRRRIEGYAAQLAARPGALAAAEVREAIARADEFEIDTPLGSYLANTSRSLSACICG